MKTAVIHENLPLIEVVEAMTLDHLLADVTAADAIVCRLSPTMAVVDPVKLSLLTARLKQLGHLPKVVDR